jgi:hypothetical protein
VKELTRVFAPETACITWYDSLYNSKSHRKVSPGGRCFIVCSVMVTVVLGPALLLQGCSKPSEPQQTSTQTSKAVPNEASRDADAKAWADASGAGTAAALTAYLQTDGSGAHAAEARQRLAELEEQARKDADEKGWADASQADTAAAITAYLQTHESGGHAAKARERLAALEKQAQEDAEAKAWTEASSAGTSERIAAYLAAHESGAHAAEARELLAAREIQARKDAEESAWTEAAYASTTAPLAAYLKAHATGAHALEARQRLAALEEKERKKDEAQRRSKAAALGIPNIDIRDTCQARAAALDPAKIAETYDGCVKSQLSYRDDIAKQWTEFTTADRALCINPRVYMPSYVEWITCLEMQRDVRNLKRQRTTSKSQP